MLERLGDRFTVRAIGLEEKVGLSACDIEIETMILAADESSEIRARYLGDAKGAIYLMRPDQHVAARWTSYDKTAILDALKTATAQGEN